jgi:hypothetical protein
MQKIGDMLNLGKPGEMAVIKARKLGPKGRPIAELYFKDELPKIIDAFKIKPPMDKRLWHIAKTNFGLIQQKVAYIHELREAENAKLSRELQKPLTAYSGLLIWLLKKRQDS